jgi:7-carboxy-7-deazaguanine synthase
MEINEIFYSLQGEGLLVGTPSIFVRTSGCNLRCTYCDTTYEYSKGTEMTIQEILTEVKKYPCSYICITGGEPLFQKETPKLIDSLLKKNYSVCLETNGSFSIMNLVGKKSFIISLDIKCPSSGSQDDMNMNNIIALSKDDQLKFIIKNKEDYLYAKEVLKKYNPICTVFFQPVWETNPKMLASWILRDGLQVRLSIQLHKIVWGAKRGV